MANALRSIVVLVGLAALGGAAIAWFAETTNARVRANRLAAETRILRELAGVDFDAAVGGDVLLCDRNVVILRGSGKGYGGEFRIAVAMAANGASPLKVQAVRVIDHAETPGFGDILKPDSAWLRAFGTGEVDAVTGATVTSRAVMAAVERTVSRLRQEELCRS